MEDILQKNFLMEFIVHRYILMLFLFCHPDVKTIKNSALILQHQQRQQVWVVLFRENRRERMDPNEFSILPSVLHTHVSDFLSPTIKSGYFHVNSEISRSTMVVLPKKIEETY